MYIFTGPSALSVNVMKNSKLSVDVQWDAVNDSLTTVYTLTWTRAGGGLQVATVTEQTSYTITGLTLDTVYTITVSAANTCGSGPGYSTSVSFPAGIHLIYLWVLLVHILIVKVKYCILYTVLSNGRE